MSTSSWARAVALYVLAALLFGIAGAANDDELKKALAGKGCDSIPYPDVRKDCETKQEAETKACKKKVACELDDPDIKPLRAKIDKDDKDVVRLEAEEHAQNEQKSAAAYKPNNSGQVESIDKQIGKIHEQIRAAKDDEDQATERVTKILEEHQTNARECLSAGTDVGAVFGDATHKGNEETAIAALRVEKQLVTTWDTAAIQHGHDPKAEMGLQQCASALANLGPYIHGKAPKPDCSAKDIKDKLDALADAIGNDYKNHPLRIQYEAEVTALLPQAEALIKAATSDVELERIAMQMWQARRDIGVKYKDATPTPLRDFIYERNIKAYGDPLGPPWSYMTTRYLTNGKPDFALIARKAAGPNKDINEVLAGFRSWLHGTCTRYL